MIKLFESEKSYGRGRDLVTEFGSLEMSPANLQHNMIAAISFCV